jgi:SAM-dependent methyltransferase
LHLPVEEAIQHRDFVDASLIHKGPWPRQIVLSGLEPLLEWGDPLLGLGADHATLSTASVLIKDRAKIRDKVVCEVGCGTGMLSVVCCKLGAKKVLATDIDPKSLECAQETIRLNRVEGSLFQGDLLDGIPETEKLDVIVSNLPQKPVSDPSTLSIAYQGGYDGTVLLRKLILQASKRLSRGSSLFLFYHSLANPQVLKLLSQHFNIVLKAWKRRIFAYSELERIFPHISRLKAEGKCFFDVYDKNGSQYFFYAMVLEGVK